MGIGALIAGNLLGSELEALHDLIPHRGVVHSALPGMTRVDQAFALRVSLPVEIVVPSGESGQKPLEERRRLRGVLGGLVHAERGGGVDRRLDDA